MPMMRLTARFSHSLSWRLVASFFFMTILLALLLNVAIRFFFQENRLDQTTNQHFERYMLAIIDEVGWPPNLLTAESLINELPVDMRIIMPGVSWQSSDRWPNIEQFTAQKIVENGNHIFYAHEEDMLFMRVIRMPFEYWISIRFTASAYNVMAIASVVALVACALLALYALTYLQLRPINAIRRGIDRFGSGDLSHRISVRNRNELGRLAKQINAMAEQIEDMLDAKRDLLLALSHELRSPLARARLAAEMLTEDDKIDEKKATIIDGINRMERLIGDLTEIERLRGAHVVLHRRKTDCNAVLTQVIQEYFPSKHIDFRPGVLSICLLDEMRMRLCMKNIIDNAIEFNDDTVSPVVITTEMQEGHLAIGVTNYGMTVDKAALAKFTEPFYRGDTARGHTRAGFGLGLHLCHQITVAHGGSLTYDSENNSVTATVVVPISPPDSEATHTEIRTISS